MIAFRNCADVIRHKFSLKLLLTDGTRHVTAVHLLVIPNYIVEVNQLELGAGQGEKKTATGFREIAYIKIRAANYLGAIVFNLDRNSNSARCIFSLAASNVKKFARSISGNVAVRPDFGGHSISNVLLFTEVGSSSPVKAQACTVLPLLCFTLPRGKKSPSGTIPVSSCNSRFAASCRPSRGLISPLGTNQAPRSLFFQNGPPRCTSSTSIWPFRSRYMSSPALVLAICFLWNILARVAAHVVIPPLIQRLSTFRYGLLLVAVEESFGGGGPAQSLRKS